MLKLLFLPLLEQLNSLVAKEPNLSKDFPILSKPLSKSVVLSLSFPNASIAWEASA
ncbi:hypothetical protein OFR45_01505 [Brachyspira hyodysenteriae]|nr:hypothetical protein [Brachyspira hyodysenteriae]MDA0059097.1 hypothetical protein [Brachyspira hyodysenteriae]